MPKSAPTEGPRCRHFGSCGGCASQDLPYPEQLRRKTSRVVAALTSAGISTPLKVHPAPEIWFYRNKMEFSFGDIYPPPSSGFPGLRLGLKPKGRWYDVLDLQECFLLSPEAPKLLQAVRDWAREHSVLPYNSHKHMGLLRHLVVREAKNGKDRLVLLVTAPGELPTEEFTRAVLRGYPATTVLRGINGKLSDTAVSDTVSLLHGTGYIIETLRFGNRELKFRISPHSFFQTNTRGAEVLYALLRSWLAEIKPRVLLDLYCGGGAIGLCAADHCGQVIGAEQNPSAVADARNNASANGILNAEFHAGSVERLSPDWLQEIPDAVVVDPPRSGLHPGAVKLLLELTPPELLYVSCNPEALARDLNALKERYGVACAEAVDLFPHAEPVETAVWLKRT